MSAESLPLDHQEVPLAHVFLMKVNGIVLSTSFCFLLCHCLVVGDVFLGSIPVAVCLSSFVGI